MSSENPPVNLSLTGDVEKILKVGRGYLITSYIIFATFVLGLIYFECQYEKNYVTHRMLWTILIYFMITIPFSYFLSIIEKPLVKKFDSLFQNN